MPRQLPGPEVPGVQFRRRRAGHLQGPRHPAVQPAHRDRGHDHRRLCDGHHRRLQLHPRRDLPDLRPLRGSAGRGEGGRLPGRQHPGLGLQLPAACLPWLRRLHLRRGNRAARIGGRQEGPAALQAAVPGELRPVRQADHDQQHRDLRGGALDHPQRRAGLPRVRQAEQRRHQDLLGVRRRRAARQLRSADGHAVRQAAGTGGRRAQGPQAQGGDPGRLVLAGAAGRHHDGAARWTTTPSPRPARCWARAR